MHIIGPLVRDVFHNQQHEMFKCAQVVWSKINFTDRWGSPLYSITTEVTNSFISQIFQKIVPHKPFLLLFLPVSFILSSFFPFSFFTSFIFSSFLFLCLYFLSFILFSLPVYTHSLWLRNSILWLIHSFLCNQFTITLPDNLDLHIM